MARTAERVDKRQHTVETAYALFKRDGFHATGIDRIIAEADVAKMTMYRNFPSKDDLIVAALDHRAEKFDAMLDRLAASVGKPAEKIAVIFDWYERWFDSPDFHGCLFAHAVAEFGDPSHPVFQAAMAQKDNFRRRLRKILEEIMSRDRAENAATTLLMLIEGATLLAEMGQGKAALRSARQAARDIMSVGKRR
ncbi:MAG TPA: TetR/AcrR family transcriptional regulator [Dongiaceae bacterium]|nr:TetR/AcrR family transcriptional regulator [Dongiaceae bacterium]